MATGRVKIPGRSSFLLLLSGARDKLGNTEIVPGGNIAALKHSFSQKF